MSCSEKRDLGTLDSVSVSSQCRAAKGRVAAKHDSGGCLQRRFSNPSEQFHVFHFVNTFEDDPSSGLPVPPVPGPPAADDAGATGASPSTSKTDGDASGSSTRAAVLHLDERARKFLPDARSPYLEAEPAPPTTEARPPSSSRARPPKPEPTSP